MCYHLDSVSFHQQSGTEHSKTHQGTVTWFSSSFTVLLMFCCAKLLNRKEHECNPSLKPLLMHVTQCWHYDRLQITMGSNRLHDCPMVPVEFMHNHTFHQFPHSINGMFIQQILESNVCPLDERCLAMQKWEKQSKILTLHM